MDPIEKEKKDDLRLSQSNPQILYFTLVIIIVLLFIWLLLLVFTREDGLKILSAMNQPSLQLTPAID